MGDKWSTREQFLLKGAGDCEEYAFTKYFTLLDLGIKQQHLFMGVANDKLANQGHMVRRYYPDHNSIPLVYDNVSFKILPLNKHTGLELRFVFNHSGNRKVNTQGHIIAKPDNAQITYNQKFYDLLVADKNNRFFK